MKSSLLKAAACLLMALGLFMGITSAAAATPEDGNYDGWSFNQWVTVAGDTRASSFSQVNSTIFLDMGGTGTNGVRFTFEPAGDGQYYLSAWFRYKTTYLAKAGKLADGDYYLGGTTYQSSALKWRLEDNGLLYTTINSEDYYLWVYCNQFPYKGSDGFRLTTSESNRYDAVNYRRLPLTPPETPHVHPVCGAVCDHEESHEDLTAYALMSNQHIQYGSLEPGDYYLTSDFSRTGNLTISGNVRLCLNGHKMDFQNGYGLVVSGSGSLEICDCQGTGSVNSYPKNDSGYYIYENRTFHIYENASLTIYGGGICAESGALPYNQGTLTVYGGLFEEGLENRGTAVIHQGTFHASSSYTDAIYNSSSMTIYDCTADSAASPALRNASTGTTVIHGGTFRSAAANGTCVYNSGNMTIHEADISCETGKGIENAGSTLELSGGTVSGKVGIYNGSWKTKTNENGGTLHITGGTVRGTECDIRNSARISTVANEDGTETRFISKGILEIVGAPTVRTIVLEQPDAFTFGYTGGEPLALELHISEDFTLGDTVWTGSPEKISDVTLMNEGCYLEADGDKVVLKASDPCAVLGHRYESIVTAPTCTEQGYTTHTCAICADSYADSYSEPTGHTRSAGLCTVCGEDTVAASLEGSTLSLTGEIDIGTQIIAAGYDSYGRFCGVALLVWQGVPLREEVPACESVRLIFLNESWIPLRQPSP